MIHHVYNYVIKGYDALKALTEEKKYDFHIEFPLYEKLEDITDLNPEDLEQIQDKAYKVHPLVGYLVGNIFSDKFANTEEGQSSFVWELELLDEKDIDICD